MSSQVTNVVVLYSASVLDLVVTFCVLLIHDIKLSLTRT